MKSALRGPFIPRGSELRPRDRFYRREPSGARTSLDIGALRITCGQLSPRRS